MATEEDFLTTLNQRSQGIFRKLVERYLATGIPVGSRQLSRDPDLDLSPASIRNVMSDLEELGLIQAPHVSAGRAPTQAGLRFFVDAMLEVGRMNAEERKEIEEHIRDGGRGGDAIDMGTPDELLTQASQMLSGLSHGAGVVVSAKSDFRLKQIEFVRLDAQSGMAILVGENGNVENRVLKFDQDFDSDALMRATNYLNQFVMGRTLREGREVLMKARETQKRELDEISQKIVDAGLGVMVQPVGSDVPTVIVRGRANLIDSAIESDDMERLRELLDELEHKRGLIDLLNEAETAEGVRIFIGSENKLFSLSGSSVILSPYRDERDSVVGVLGVIGPTRLNYSRIVPAVDYTAMLVSRIIQRQK